MVAKAFHDEIDWLEVLPNALFVAIVLKKNYLAIEEYFLPQSFGNSCLEKNLNSVFV